MFSGEEFYGHMKNNIEQVLGLSYKEPNTAMTQTSIQLQIGKATALLSIKNINEIIVRKLHNHILLQTLSEKTTEKYNRRSILFQSSTGLRKTGTLVYEMAYATMILSLPKNQ